MYTGDIHVAAPLERLGHQRQVRLEGAGLGRRLDGAVECRRLFKRRQDIGYLLGIEADEA